MKFSKFIPLVKMEEQADGSLLVYGLVTEQKPDLDKEVCDYATTKPLYEKRTKERWDFTSKIAGMSPSLMAARGQHDPKQAIGAGRTIEFYDDMKAIKMGFQIVDTEAVKKWKAGVFIGFSQGGDYVNKWADPDFAGCTRYTADPFEVSSVDAPCLPSALVETMKGRTVTLAKSAGVTEEVQLQTTVVDTHLADRFLRSKPAVKSMLGSNDWTADERSTIRKSAAALGILPSERDRKAITKACATISIRKGMYEVGSLARILEDLDWLCIQTEYERELEGDDSKVPDELRESWQALIASFKALAIEEADEMAARGGKGEKSMKITDQAGLTKAAKTMMDHLEKHMEMHKSHHEKLEGMLAKDHPLVKSSQSMMDHCEKCMKAAKDAGAGDEPEEAEKVAPVAGAGALSKAEREEFDALKKSTGEISTKFDELLKKLEKTPAGGAPHSGADPLAKSIVGTFDELLTPETVAK